MRCFVFTSPMLIALSAMIAVAETTAQSEKQSIPLKDVIAYFMPGTRNVHELNPSPAKDLVEPILGSLVQKGQQDAKQGFVVQGNDKDALKTAYDVLVTGKSASRKVNSNEKTWIVFFAVDSMQHVHLREVLRHANQITIRYQFVPHDSKEPTREFALIPLGALPAGQYRVSMDNASMEQRDTKVRYQPIPESSVHKIVCKPFEFVVTRNTGP